MLIKITLCLNKYLYTSLVHVNIKVPILSFFAHIKIGLFIPSTFDTVLRISCRVGESSLCIGDSGGGVMVPGSISKSLSDSWSSDINMEGRLAKNEQ